MLHNLKRTLTIANTANWLDRWAAATVVPQTTTFSNTSQAIIRYYTSDSNKVQLVKCWNCGNQRPSADIQFKCSKCENLLDLPNDVVSECI